MTMTLITTTTRCHDCCEPVAHHAAVGVGGEIVCHACLAAAYVRCDGCWQWRLTGDVEAVGTQIICEHCMEARR